MGIGEIAWCIFLGGLPFSHILFRPLDPWHGQALWAQGWAVTLFGLSMWKGIKWVDENKPLASLTIWILLSACWMSLMAITKVGGYPIGMLQGISHFLLIVMLYISACSLWTVSTIETILKTVAVSASLVVLYGFCQLAFLDQFFKSMDDPTTMDVLGGTIGNPTHFGAYLSLALPAVLIQRGLKCKALAVALYLVAILTNSSTAIFSTSLLIAWFLFRINLYYGIVFSFILALVTFFVMSNYAAYWLSPSGRLETWPVFFEILRESRPITGNGIGYIMEYSKRVPEGSIIYHWRHVHNEYFQMAIETGLVGLGFILWMIKDTIQRISKIDHNYDYDEIRWALGAMFLTFLFHSFFSFPMHLWLLGSLGLVAYCGIRTVSVGES